MLVAPSRTRRPRAVLAGELGFEPRLPDPESGVLPLHYSPMVMPSIQPDAAEIKPGCGRSFASAWRALGAHFAAAQRQQIGTLRSPKALVRRMKHPQLGEAGVPAGRSPDVCPWLRQGDGSCRRPPSFARPAGLSSSPSAPRRRGPVANVSPSPPAWRRRGASGKNPASECYSWHFLPGPAAFRIWAGERPQGVSAAAKAGYGLSKKKPRHFSTYGTQLAHGECRCGGTPPAGRRAILHTFRIFANSGPLACRK